MRLIDADKVIDHLEKVKKESRSLVDIAHIIGFQSVIDAQPTAYDVDKVVAQLEEYREEMEQFKCGGMLSDMIEVVKAGGVDAKTDS